MALCLQQCHVKLSAGRGDDSTVCIDVDVNEYLIQSISVQASLFLSHYSKKLTLTFNQ